MYGMAPLDLRSLLRTFAESYENVLLFSTIEDSDLVMVGSDGPLDLSNCVGQYDLHICTPESATTTHYFFATRRNHLEEDGEFNEMKIKAMHDAFVTEDGPALDAAHKEDIKVTTKVRYRARIDEKGR